MKLRDLYKLGWVKDPVVESLDGDLYNSSFEFSTDFNLFQNKKELSKRNQLDKNVIYMKIEKRYHLDNIVIYVSKMNLKQYNIKAAKDKIHDLNNQKQDIDNQINILQHKWIKGDNR